MLDLMLPGLDGEEVCRRMRSIDRDVAIIMLTAKRTTLDIVKGLDSGADDYLKKPFEMPELLARIRALARRKTDKSKIIRYADLALDMEARTAQRGGTNISLTTLEFDLLACLLANGEHVLSRDQLYQSTWREPYISSNVVDVLIGRIRRKIDDPFDRKLIHTIRGLGYVLRETS
ncbi:MAG: response regulator transcription factor [Actinobacteria bacterium]|nr:response regulator transcription factor [Actinomycetota bacterium]